jgi:carboxylesterase
LTTSALTADFPVIDDLIGPNGFIDRRGDTAVLLIHGLTGTPAEMKHFGKVIARKGVSVACPELAGHCASIEALTATKWQDWYHSVEQAFEAMSREFKQVFVCGLSMGALLGLVLAANKGKRLSGVILLSATFEYDGWNISRFKHKYLLPIVLYSPLRYLLKWEEPPPYGIKCERTRAMVAAVLSNKDAQAPDKIGYFKTPAIVIYESVKLIKATKQKLQEVTIPTLIVHSTEDDMASVKNAYYVQQNIATQQAQVETFFVDDTYHVLTLDKRKDDIARRVADFCKSFAVPA